MLKYRRRLAGNQHVLCLHLRYHGELLFGFRHHCLRPRLCLRLHLLHLDCLSLRISRLCRRFLRGEHELIDRLRCSYAVMHALVNRPRHPYPLDHHTVPGLV